jgi:hypothetical protein
MSEVLTGFAVPALPGNAPATSVFALIKYVDSDGDVSSAACVAGELDDDELLGTLTGYVEHLKRVSADGWGDFDSTRADT